MCLPVGTTIHPMGYAPPTHMRAQPPQQYYPPQQMFVQQQQFYPGPQYSRQPGMDYDPHAATMSTMYMGQQITHPTPMAMQPPPQQVQQQQRNKNILTIQDPNTLEEVDLGARSDSAAETKKEEPKGRKDIDETEQKKSEVMRQFTRQLQERNEMDQAESTTTTSLASKPDSSRETTPVSSYNPPEEPKPAAPDDVPETIETPAAEEPIPQDSTHESEPSVEEPSPAESIPEPTATVEEPQTPVAVSVPPPAPAPSPTPVLASAPEPQPAEKEPEVTEEAPDVPDVKTDAEAPTSNAPEDSAIVDDQEESIKSDVATAETVTESTVDQGSAADVEAEESSAEVVETPDAPTPDTEEEERRKAEEFKRCPCPLSHDKIVKLGIDLSSMPKGSDNKKQHSFIPPWMNQSRQSNKPSNRPYGGRFSHNDHRGGKGGGNKKFPPSARPSIERNIERGVPLHKAENAWKPEKIRPEDLEKEEARIKVINIIFDKAVEEPKFCPIYAEVCKQQVDKELKENSKLSLCRNALLNRAQETFVNKTWEEERNVRVKAIEEEEDPKKKLQLQVELQEADNKFRRRKFGNITFIGQLYRQSLLSTKIVQWCLFDLIKHTHRNSETGKLPEPPFDEESLQCAIQLIESLGKQLDVSSPDFNGKEYLDQTLHHLECISTMTSNKIRFMIMNVIELRQSRWIPRKGTDQGPKKLAEIHNEIKREQMENQIQRDQYDRKLRTGGSTSQHGRNPPPPRNSLDNRFGPKGGDRRSIAASKAKQTPSSVQPKSGDNSLGGSNRKTWHQGSGGGGNNSTTEAAKAGWQKPGRDEIPRKNSSADERASALAATKSGSIGKPEATPEPDLEEMKALREDLYKKIGKEVAAILETYDEGDMKLDECVSDIFKMVDAEAYGRPSVNEVFSRFTEYAVEKVRRPLLSKLSHILCLALQNPETKSEALAGMARYCSLAVECEMWMDIPDIWSKLAELLVNAVYSDQNLVPGVRPSFKDFTNVFIEAAKDERKDKPYELLVLSLKRMTQESVE
ncbi:MIF4G domain protein [Teladorsagia circumcincta]|uniref:MIF4G domain protein n=1 Tax=Teladorsagia circumcincta TaxID=45464 RepID=A0A2G9V616_TELCI|nr:MIF4G domain protein [Teladorsagia circumcincta]